MATIAMVIQQGADTRDFAASLADELGCDIVDNRPRELLLAATTRRNPRRLGAWLQSVSPRSQWNSSAKAVSFGMDSTWREAVRSKHVLIVGWHAVLSLPTHETDIRVLLHIPRKTRTARLAAPWSESDTDDAERAVSSMERHLSAHLEAMHGRDWIASHHFDLTINASRCTPQICCALIRSWLDCAPVVVSGTTISSLPDAESEPIGLTTGLGRHTGHDFAVVDRERVDLSSVQSHEAAIAAIEQRLHRECHRRHD